MNIQKMEEISFLRTNSPDPSIVTFLTFRPANILNGDGILLAGSQLAGKSAVDAIEPVSLIGAVGEINPGGPVAVDTPAHAQGSELPDLIHLLNWPVTGLTLDLAGLGVLGMAEKNVIGKVVDLHPFDRMAILRVFPLIRVIAGIAI